MLDIVIEGGLIGEQRRVAGPEPVERVVDALQLLHEDKPLSNFAGALHLPGSKRSSNVGLFGADCWGARLSPRFFDGRIDVVLCVPTTFGDTLIDLLRKFGGTHSDSHCRICSPHSRSVRPFWSGEKDGLSRVSPVHTDLLR